MASGERVPVASSPPPGPTPRSPQARVRSVTRSWRATDDDTADVVPRVLRVSAALGWRLLVVVAALYVIGVVVSYVAAVVVPVAIALLLAALLAPAVHWLQSRRVPRGVATALVLIGGLVVLGGVLTFVVVTFVRGVPDLASQLTASINDIADWLRNGPLNLSDAQFRSYQTQILDTLSANQASITAGALTTAATVGETLTEILLVVFTLIFFLHGGLGIWQFLLAVPLLAVLNSGIRSLLSAADEHVDPEDVHTSEPEETGPDEPDLQREPDLTN